MSSLCTTCLLGLDAPVQTGLLSPTPVGCGGWGKEAYLFTYNGEPHGLRKRQNQKDYTMRLQRFFDHFLKGAEAGVDGERHLLPSAS